MKDQMALLIKLKKMESAAGRIQVKKNNLLVRKNTLEDEFRLFSAVVDAKREQLKNLRNRRREKDVQLLTAQEALKRARERLFDIKTEEKYQAMLKEIETFEATNSGIEDEMISLLDKLDRLETKFKTDEVELETHRRRYEEENVRIEEELNSLTGELNVCVQKGSELEKEIPAEILRKYEKFSGHMIETINKLIQTSHYLMQELGRKPNLEEIANKMMFPLEKLKMVLKIAEEPISMETPIKEDEDSHLAYFVEDKKIMLPEGMTGIELAEQTQRLLSTLTPREEVVLRMRFGISEREDYSAEESRDSLELTKERTKQIESSANRKLRKKSRRRLLKPRRK